jgi:hypothetical protein
MHRGAGNVKRSQWRLLTARTFTAFAFVLLAAKPSLPEPPMRQIIGWDIKKGQKGATAKFRSGMFTCDSPWKIECRTRGDRDNGHLIIRVFRKGETSAFSEAVRIIEEGIRGGSATIEEAGTFFLEIDAKTVWWWAHVNVPDHARTQTLDDLKDIAEHIKNGEVWARQRTPEGFAWDWMQTEGKSKTDLVEIRDHLELLYDAGSLSVPGGDRGARMMLRLLADRIGPNLDPDNALQIRVYCSFPTRVDAPWQDKEGKLHQYQHEVEDAEAYANLVAAQIQDWSDKLFRISGGKLALDFKVIPTRSPLTKFERAGERYWVSPDCVKDIMSDALGNVGCFVFWIPTDGADFPPKDSNACYVSGDIAGAGRSRCIFCLTSMDRLSKSGGWTDLNGGLPHEFWHFTQSLLRESGFGGFIPDNHSADDWQILCDELRLQGTEPRSQYEDLYPTIMSWRTLEKLKRRYGRIPWGKGPQLEASQ